MKSLPHLIFTLGAILSVWLGTQAFLQASAEHEKAETVRVQYYAVSKMLDAEIAYTNLEIKRTTVQREIRNMVIAEYRKCKKGSCK